MSETPRDRDPYADGYEGDGHETVRDDVPRGPAPTPDDERLAAEQSADAPTRAAVVREAPPTEHGLGVVGLIVAVALVPLENPH